MMRIPWACWLDPSAHCHPFILMQIQLFRFYFQPIGIGRIWLIWNCYDLKLLLSVTKFLETNQVSIVDNFYCCRCQIFFPTCLMLFFLCLGFNLKECYVSHHMCKLNLSFQVCWVLVWWAGKWRAKICTILNQSETSRLCVLLERWGRPFSLSLFFSQGDLL